MKNLRLFCLGLALLAAPPVLAQTWTGFGPPGNWSAPSNWSPTVVPNSPGAIANFTGAGPFFIGGASPAQLGQYFFSGPASYTIATNGAVRLYGVGPYPPISINNQSITTQAIATRLVLMNDQEWLTQNSGAVTQVLGDVRVNGFRLFLDGAGDLEVGTAGQVNQLDNVGLLIKNGSGNASIYADNSTWGSGSWIVNDGRLTALDSGALGAPTVNNYVHNGGTLSLDGSIGGGISLSEKQILIDGFGAGGVDGAIRSEVGKNTIGTYIELLGDASIVINADALAVVGQVQLQSHQLFLYGNGPSTYLELNAQIDGSGFDAMTFVTDGNYVIDGTSANSFTGRTRVNEGTVTLAKAGVGLDAISSDLYVGDDAGGPATVRTAVSEQINDAANVFVDTDGLFMLGSGLQEGINRLSMSGGVVDVNGARLILYDNVFYTGASATAFIQDSAGGGFVYLNPPFAPNTNFDIADGASGVDLQVSAVIQGGLGIGIDKTGPGTLEFLGANGYTGTTTVYDGKLLIGNGLALGSTAGNTVVQPGGTLALEGGINISGESLQIAGSGNGLPGNEGALRNESGFNTWSGPVDLLSDATLYSADPSGQLDILGGAGYLMDVGNFQATLDGPGDIVIDGNIVGGAAPVSVFKFGTGTTTFTGGANSYTGLTQVSQGTLELAKPSGTDSVAGDLQIDHTGLVRLQSDQQIRDSRNVAIFGAGVFDLNGHREIIRNLDLTRGTVLIPTQFLLVQGVLTTHADPGPAQILGGGALRLDNGAFSPSLVNVANGPAPVDLLVTTRIIANNGFIKTGLGTMTVANTVNTAGQNIRLDQGTLQLANSNIVDNATGLDLNGGTFATNGFSDTVGALTMSANSTLDMGAGASVLNFGGFNVSSYGGAVLAIANWSGLLTGGGLDQIFFPVGLATNPAFLAFLANIDWTASGYSTGAIQLGSGEIVPIPVPEPGAIAAALVLCGAIGWSERRRLRAYLAARRAARAS